MKKLIATIATVVFAGSVQAASDVDVYHGFAAGNPELSSDLNSVSLRSDRSQGSYDSFVYNGFEQGNTELSQGSQRIAARSATQPEIGDSFDRMDRSVYTGTSIYNGFEVGNPEL